MDKVGILTFHAAHNYGSMLQAYALKHVINSLGFDSYIINYRNQRQQKLYSVFSVGIKTQVFHLLHLRKYIKRYHAFENYLVNALTDLPCMTSMSDVVNLVKDFKAIVTGSDQIWNQSANTYDADMIYLLPFPFKGKKIAYAPSMGSDIDVSFIKDNLLKYMENYSALSAREIKLADCLGKLMNKKMETVLDPTLLVDENLWDEQLVPIKERGYICFYSLIYSDDLVKLTLEAARLLHLDVINLSPRAKYASISAFKQKYDVGPKKFVSYIKNADLVITNSFHGTVFSIIEETPLFSVILDKNKPDFRRQNLFQITQLNDMYFDVFDINTLKDRYERLKDTDYALAKQRIREAKRASIEYLRKALS